MGFSYKILILLCFIWGGLTAQEESQPCYSDILTSLTTPDDSTVSVDWYPFPWQSVRLLPNMSFAINMITTIDDLIHWDIYQDYELLLYEWEIRYSDNHQLVGSQFALQYWEYNGAEIYSTTNYIPDEIPGAISIKRLENGLYHVSMAVFYKFQIQ